VSNQSDNQGDAVTQPSHSTGSSVALLEERDTPWVCLLHNDDVNTFDYVIFVLQKLFGFSVEKADQVAKEVHETGRGAVSSGTRAEMEADALKLCAEGLSATIAEG
jgi:ATP-dependent Clp protease adaptor protein ClpS